MIDSAPSYREPHRTRDVAGEDAAPEGAEGEDGADEDAVREDGGCYARMRLS